MASEALGKLCYVSSGALAYKYEGGSSAPLVYKAEGRQWCTIKIQFGNQSWVCNTYDCYHEIQYSASGSWTTGTGSVETSYSTADCAEFKVKPKGNSATTYTVTVTASTSCGALEKENPGASCSAAAAQKSASPKSRGGISCAPNVSISIRVNFDSSGKLSSIS